MMRGMWCVILLLCLAGSGVAQIGWPGVGIPGTVQNLTVSDWIKIATGYLSSDSIYTEKMVADSMSLGGVTIGEWPGGGGGSADSSWVSASAAEFTVTDLKETEGYWNIYAGPSGWSLTRDTLYNEPTFRGTLGKAFDAYNIEDTTVVFFADLWTLDSLYSVTWDGTSWSGVTTEAATPVAANYGSAMVCFGNADTSYVYFSSVGTGVTPTIEMIKTGGSWTVTDTTFTAYSHSSYPCLSVCQDSSGNIYSWQPTSESQYILFRRNGPTSWSPVDTVATDTAFLFDDLRVTDNQKIVSFLGQIGELYVYDIAAGKSSTVDLSTYFTGSPVRNYQGCRIDICDNIVYVSGMETTGADTTSVVAVDCSVGADSLLWAARWSGNIFRAMVQYDPTREVVYLTGWNEYSSVNETVRAIYSDGTVEVVDTGREACLLWWNDSFGDMVLFEQGASGNDFVFSTPMASASGHNTGSATGAMKLSAVGGDLILEADSGTVVVDDPLAVQSFGGLIRYITTDYIATANDFQIVGADTANVTLPDISTLVDSLDASTDNGFMIGVMTEFPPCTVFAHPGDSILGGTRWILTSKWQNILFLATRDRWIER